jgi:hypothetical protein
MGLDDFTRAYVECALWASTDNADESGGEPLDANYGIEDIDPTTLATMIEDCRRFQEENAADLALYNHPEWSAADLGGHDFFLTRNHHGAGFWDRDCLPEDAGQRLTEAAEKFGEVDLTVGEDGWIY